MALPWVASILKWLGHGQYNSTPPELEEGEVSSLQLDENANLKVALVSAVAADEPAAVTALQTTALSYGQVLKASAGKLVEIVGFNDSEDDVYVFLCNATSVPANATETASVIYKAIRVPAGGSFSFTPARRLTFSTGISWVCSSTLGTITQSTSVYITSAIVE
jgi:hypothetical protein